MATPAPKHAVPRRWSPRARGRLGQLGAAAAVAALFLCGCGGADEPAGEATLRVYVSMPLRGAEGEHGRAIVDGAKLALEDAGGEAGGVEVDAVYLDSTAGRKAAARSDPVVIAENARTATRDASTIAYIGEFESAATKTSLPITNQAEILQVSPSSASPELVADPPGSAGPVYQPTGVRNFGRVVGADKDEPIPAETDPAFSERYEQEYGQRPDPWAAYGYEAMAVVLDSIERASDPGDRGAVIDAFFATSDRDSILGTYSIDEFGDTTLSSSAPNP